MTKTAIVLSGLPGAGKSTVVTALSDFYGLPAYSIRALWRAKYAKEHPDGDITFENYWRRQTIEQNKAANVEAKSLFESGTVIGDSRYLYVLERSSQVLRVFVTAPLSVRAQRLTGNGRYPGKNQEEIATILEQRETDEVRMGKHLYGETYDYRDMSRYNIGFDTERLSPDCIMQTLTRILDIK